MERSWFPLIYEFVPEDVPGYTWTVKQNGSDWVIEYIQDQPDSLTVTPEKLVLTVDGWANVTISEHFASDVYDSLEWQTEGTEDVIEVRHISGNTYQVRAKATGISTLTAKLGEDLKSNPCTVVVIPKELSMDPVSLTTGGQKQLTVKEAELLEKAGLTVSWTSDDPKVAYVSASGLVKAVGAGTTTIRASVQTDKKTVSGAGAVTVTAAGGNNGRGNGGGGDNGNNKGGSGSGGGGTLKGQKTSGGTYSDRLVGTASQGSTASSDSTSDAAVGTTQNSTSQSQTAGQETEAATAEDSTESGDGEGEGLSGRVISVEEGDGDETSDTGKALATLLATGGLLLTAGVLHGKRKGES